jgi:UDP-N-acetyl-D-glucosamine dehydrogenase
MADTSLISEQIERASGQPSSAAADLKERITKRTARVGVLGLGYVGLPLAVEFANAGFEVTGIDVQQSKVINSTADDPISRTLQTTFSSR